jgi:signal transduction histidine kinase
LETAELTQHGVSGALQPEAACDILVVDDNPSNLLAIEVALGELHCRIIKAASGREALRYLLEQDVALILLDIQMPTMDGFETARLIRQRERSRHVPIIFITAFSREERDILHGYELGAVDFLFKPIVPEMLRAKASVFVELRRRTAEVMRQAELLREHERKEHERRLTEERQRWEGDALRRQMEEERRKTAELGQIIAERERAEAELTRINHQLEEADRRKDEFLAMLSHELRNPLAPMVTSLELLGLDPPESVPQRRALEVIERQLKHLTRLVDDLLDVARVTSGKIELRKAPVDLSASLEQAIATSRPAIRERNHDLLVKLPQEPIRLFADGVRLTQIVSNLLNNAARYTDPGGRIELSAVRDGDEVVIRVIDNGRGIPLELSDRIFDVFFQKLPGAGGLGLGLTLVRRLVELHGGTVSARSEGEGKGSEFEVRLPAPPDLVVSERTPSDRPPLDLRALRVVVIEDNADIRDMLRTLLELHGCQVRVADNGADGVELVLSAQPDVALVDIAMPELDGYSVARRVSAALGDVRPRLVAMTGYGQDSDRRRSQEAGFDAHLVKPVTQEALLRALAPE